MKSKILVVGMMAMIGATQVFAQSVNTSAAVKIPLMEFDESITSKAIAFDEMRLPTALRIDRLSIVLGRTTLTDVTKHLKTGIPLHDGKGYYQCYSIPKYSHQLWLVTEGQDFSAPITELVVMRGNPLPTDYCPVITASTYPIFSNKIRLELATNLVNTVLGEPTSKKGESAVYLYQMPRSEMLKVQTHIGSKGLDKIKITQGTTVLSTR